MSKTTRPGWADLATGQVVWTSETGWTDDGPVQITLPALFFTYWADALGGSGEVLDTRPDRVTVLLSPDAVRALFAAAGEYMDGAQYAYHLRRSARATWRRILQHSTTREIVRDLLRA
jgi:hypothetical protein